jgi:uncharacterized damage-inducible protein DinB
MTSATVNQHKTDTSIAQAMLQEFEQELGTTRKFLERVPEDRLGWKPHPKSMTAGQLALHIAQSPAGVLDLGLHDRPEAPDFSGGRPQPTDLREVLDTLEQGAAHVRATLPTIDDARMQQPISFTRNGTVLMTMPRIAFLRNILLNHVYHHRGQLGVYLRLLGATVPMAYGPSGDESPF